MLYLDNPFRALGLSGDAPLDRIDLNASPAGEGEPLLATFDDGRFLAGTDAIVRLRRRHDRLLARIFWFTSSTPLDRRALAILDGSDVSTAVAMWNASDDPAAGANVARAFHLGLIVRDLMQQGEGVGRAPEGPSWNYAVRVWETLLSDSVFWESLLAIDGDSAPISAGELDTLKSDALLMLVRPSIDLIAGMILAGGEEPKIFSHLENIEELDHSVRRAAPRSLARHVAGHIVARVREHMAVSLKAILADIDRQFRKRNTIGELVRIGYRRWVTAALEPLGRMKMIFGEEATAVPASFGASGLEALAERANEAGLKRFAMALMREARDISPSEREQVRIQKEMTVRKSSSVERRLLWRAGIFVVISIVVRLVVLPMFDAPPKGSIIVTGKANVPLPETALVPEPMPRHLRDSLGMLVGSVVLGPLFDTLADRKVDVEERMKRLDSVRATIEMALGTVDPLIGGAAHDEDARRKLAGFLPALKTRLSEFDAGYRAYVAALDTYNGVVARVGERGLAGKFHVEHLPSMLFRLSRGYRKKVEAIDALVRGETS